MYRVPLRISCTTSTRPILVQRHFRRTVLTTSYARGPTTPPLLELTVPQHFESIVSKYADKTAVVSRAQNQRLTYEELNFKSNALAKALQKEVGVKKGDRVAVSLGNNVEFATVRYDTWSIDITSKLTRTDHLRFVQAGSNLGKLRRQYDVSES